MSHQAKHEHLDGTVRFNNNVVISQEDFDALFKLKAHVTCMPSFVWSELLRLKENENSLKVYYLKVNFKRKQKALEILRDSGHFNMLVEEVIHNKKKKIKLSLSDISEDFKSIIPLI